MPSSVLTVPAKLLSFLLAGIFIMAALPKLLPSHPMHQEMLDHAPEWLDALQLSKLGIDPHTLRISIGSAEIVFALLIIITPAAAFGLATIMLGAILTHYIIDGNKFTQEVIPAAVLSILLVIHIILHAAIRAATKTELRSQQSAKTD